jgi:hypothetical protein
LSFSAVAVLLALVIFSEREYQDLT